MYICYFNMGLNEDTMYGCLSKPSSTPFNAQWNSKVNWRTTECEWMVPGTHDPNV